MISTSARLNFKETNMPSKYKRLLLSLLTGCALASPTLQAFSELKPPTEYKKVSIQLVEMLEGIHYNKTQVDDRISSLAFDAYIDSLDPSKSFFLADDIKSFEQYRYRFDDAISTGDVTPAFHIYNLYSKRVEDRLNKVLNDMPAMIKGFNFEKEEVFNADPDQAVWAETEAQLVETWRKRIKNRVLTLRLNNQEEDSIETSLTRRYNNQLNQIEQTNAVDVYQIFANAITEAFDPHTSYFAPRASETFSINMSLSLEGIGAVLQQEDEYTQVVRLVPAGPADNQGELKPNDKIVAVGQEGKDMIDVVGMRLDDVVDMIRGERDTEVRLEIIPSNSDGQSNKIITIVRKKVKLEDQSAKKEIVEVERNGEIYKVGVIQLPTFYSDFAAIKAGDRNYKSSTRDTKNLIEELRQEGIDALILDLRNNGGGSLQEANALTGLFIPAGPVVQIRDSAGRVSILGDQDRSVTYSGPMAVLINRMSASASEIVAGAIQDYGRGLILGGQTFGKGTVQILQDLDLGKLKITQSKFYRVSGESTQHKGVMPDIPFPSMLDANSVGESALDNPLPWDQILETRYPVYWDIPKFIPELEQRHLQRIDVDPNFIALEEQLEQIKEQSDNFSSISLNEQNRINQREESEEQQLDRENTRREALNLELITSLDDMSEEEPEDIYSKEAAEILLDFIGMNQRQQQ